MTTSKTFMKALDRVTDLTADQWWDQLGHRDYNHVQGVPFDYDDDGSPVGFTVGSLVSVCVVGDEVRFGVVEVKVGESLGGELGE